MSKAQLTGGAVFSTNYFVGEEEISLEDAQGTLRIYDDTKTASGNVARVGSPKLNPLSGDATD